jgi:predicted nuclease of predicted toxin-antitoxin system
VTVWLDAQLSPVLATWFRQTLDVSAVAVRDLQLRNATDAVIFQAARDAHAVVLTKDADFVRLLEQQGPPPQVVWITCGNTSNAALTRLIAGSWATVSALLGAGEPLVELSGPLL